MQQRFDQMYPLHFYQGKNVQTAVLALTGFEAKLTLSSDKDKGTRSQSKEKNQTPAPAFEWR